MCDLQKIYNAEEDWMHILHSLHGMVPFLASVLFCMLIGSMPSKHVLITLLCWAWGVSALLFLLPWK